MIEDSMSLQSLLQFPNLVIITIINWAKWLDYLSFIVKTFEIEYCFLNMQYFVEP